MIEQQFRWGIPEKARTRDEELLASAIGTSGEIGPEFIEGTVRSRTFDQYKIILRHNGAPDIFTDAHSIMDAKCGGLTALIGMREEFGPGKILQGFDIQDILLANIRRSRNRISVPAIELAKKFDIQFYQGTFHSVGHQIPTGYDALVAIPSFNVNDWESSYPLEVLQTLYHGLRTGGSIQTLIQIPNDMIVLMKECFDVRGIPFEFTPGSPDVLWKHGLYPRGTSAQVGTLTMGPKI